MSCGAISNLKEAHGFLPPSYPVVPAGSANDATPEIPAFLDLTGFAVQPPPASVRIVWETDALNVILRWASPGVFLTPETPVSDSAFWRQDHLDLRVIRPSDGIVWQVTLTPDGRWKDSTGLWETQESGIFSKRDGEQTVFRIPSIPMGVDRFETGQILRGLVAITTWSADRPSYVSSSATELGFGQTERYGEWRITNALPVSLKLHDGVPQVLQKGRPVSAGILTWSLKPGTGPERTLLQPLQNAPEENFVFPHPAGFPGFTRVGASWTDEAGISHPLGAFTYRAPLASRHIDPKKGLLFAPGDLKQMRDKLASPPFDRVAARLDSLETFLAALSLPPHGEPIPLTFSRSCMNWFRVGKETLLRDGEQNNKPSARRIWELQSPRARETWKALVAEVKAKEEFLDILIPELNRLLALRDLYDPVAFQNIHLPNEARDLLAKGTENLTDAELIRFNRILLESSVECILPFRTDLAGLPGKCFRRWVAEPDERLVRAATDAVRAAVEATILPAEFHLQEGMASSALALAYDAFRPMLSQQDRGLWKKLIDRYLTLYLQTAEQKAWTIITIANANPVGNSGAGLLALAIAAEDPELSVRVLNHVRVLLWRWLDSCQGADGGNTEGLQYWHYALEHFVPFAVALERTTGTDDGLLSHPSIRNGLNMIRLSLSNDGASHGLNDTMPLPLGGTLAWFLGARFGDPLGLWYGDHCLRWYEKAEREGGTKLPYGPDLFGMLLFRPPVEENFDPPALPNVFVLHSVEMGMLRSSPQMDARWTVCLKGARPPFTHHNQADAGSFSVDLRGERLLLDPGYYKDKASDHNLVLVEGTGPKPAEHWSAPILGACEVAGVKFATLDATQAYAGKARKLHRHFALTEENALIVVEDIILHDSDSLATGESLPAASAEADQPFPLKWMFQGGGPTETLPGGQGVLIRGQRTGLRIECFSGVGPVVELHPERNLKDIPWGYYFAKARWFPFSVGLGEEPTSPVVWVLTESERTIASGTQVERCNSRIQVTLPTGRTIGFSREPCGWKFQPPSQPK